MCCDGFISVPIVDDTVNAVSDVAKNVNDTVNNALDNAGTAIDQTVRNDIPGGWATVGAVAATVATAGAAGAFDAAAVGADAGAAAAGADAGASVGALGADAGAAGADAGVAGADAGLVGPSASLASAPGDAYLPGALSGDAAATTTFGLPTWANSALTGAEKGMATNALVSALSGQPITPKGLLISGISGGVGGGLADYSGSNFLGGLGAVGTNLLLNKSFNPAQAAGSFISPLLSNVGSGSNTGTSGLSNTSGTNIGTDTSGTPKGKFLKGQQIALPLDNLSTLPTTTDTTTSNVDPMKLQGIENQLQLQQIQNAATGGIMHKANGGDLPMASKQLRGQAPQRYNPFGLHGAALFSLPSLANGGGMSMEERTLPEEHHPEFFSEGGLNSIKNRYVTGAGDGTSDSIPAMLANGEFVIPADIVSGLGNGSNDSGAKVLDEFLKVVRAHKKKHDTKHLPPDSEGPLAYLLQAKQKVRA